MQIPILSGIYTNRASDFRVSYPINLVPVTQSEGISDGYLRPADGIIEFNNIPLPGVDRGAINWEDVCYRVLGNKLVKLSKEGNVSILGEVGGARDQIAITYSFDFLAVVSEGNLYYYSSSTNQFQHVTDPNLGVIIDITWVGGYFMMTDGEFLIVTELNDPTVIDPFKYGSAEVDPDPILAVHRIFNEVYSVNRYTIEVFVNVGGSGFPFQKVDGAQMTRGSIGTHCTCVFENTIAFIGGGRKESISIWLGAGGNTTSIASREINLLLKTYSQEELSAAILETRVDNSYLHLYVHLPDKTLVYDAAATRALGQPVWFVLTAGINRIGPYLARNLIWCYDKWIAGDPINARIGFMSDEVSTLYGEITEWEFATSIIYNEGRGAIFYELELVGLPGRAEFGENPIIDTQYSLDGEVWSQRKYIRAGKFGDRLKRLVWLSQGDMRNWRIQRFHGTSDSRLTVARLEARLESLEV